MIDTAGWVQLKREADRCGDRAVCQGFGQDARE